MSSLSFFRATAPGGWADGNDDRLCADPARGLFYVGDASGPTYGGYYAPFGVDPALATFESVFRCEEGDAPARLRTALLAAHEHMRALSRAYNVAFEEIHRKEPDGLRASLQAADRVRPASWERLRGRSFAHFTASLTACCIERDRLAVIQAGSGRAYRLRQDVSELLALDHTLPSILQAAGKPSEQAAHFHRSVVVSMLGTSAELQVNEACGEARVEDRILLCSDGIWAHDEGNDAVAALLRASTATEFAEIVETAAARRCDATAVLISIS